MNQYLSNIINSSGSKNFGWLEPYKRTSEQNQLNFDLISQMPEFRIDGSWEMAQQSQIWDCVRKITGGKNLAALYQQIGSCVGHGKCNAEWYLSHVQSVVIGRQLAVLPYEPYGYAQSRVCAGISGGEDGSTGAGAADAARKYGVLDSRISDVPKFQQSDSTIIFAGETDKSWGNRGAPEKYIPEGQKHLVKTTALIKSTDDAVAALVNNYPLTLASNWGGKMKPDLKGSNPAVLLNVHDTQWNHQMSCTNFMDHPELGIIFYIQNSWGPDSHGVGPNNEPLGGFWIAKGDMQSIISQNEVFAYSQFDGFPSNKIDQSLLMLI